MTKTRRKRWATGRQRGKADRLTVGNGETRAQEIERYKLVEKALDGDTDAIIEYLTRYGGKEWQQ